MTPKLEFPYQLVKCMQNFYSEQKGQNEGKFYKKLYLRENTVINVHLSFIIMLLQGDNPDYLQYRCRSVLCVKLGAKSEVDHHDKVVCCG